MVPDPARLRPSTATEWCALTEGGDLACLRARDGGIIWHRNVLVEFEAPTPTYLMAESPLVDGGRVYVAPAGPNAGIVALDKMTGKTI